MIVIVDNYDSFSYNLYQMVGSLYPDIRVVRNDTVTPQDIMDMEPEAIIISPGPGRPEDAGICVDLIRAAGPTIPILGVCLGHQAICLAYGGKITYAKHLMHGKQSMVTLAKDPLFEGLPDREPVARYHSLAADGDSIPQCLETISATDEGEIMAVRHREYPIYGLQFHPESVMTPCGKTILRNFLKIAGVRGVSND